MAGTTLLANLLANNWYYHDRKEYAKIEQNACNLLLHLGYGRRQASLAGRIISKIFSKADAAEKYQKIRNHEQEMKTYTAAKQLADDVDMILGRNKNAYYEINWWITIRHRKIWLSHIFLFLDQLVKLGPINIYQVLKATNYLARAGFAHDKKNWKDVRTCLINYWSCIGKTKVKNYLEF